MYAQTVKSKENKSRAVANSIAQKKSNAKQGVGFMDNRPEAMAQRLIQEKVCSEVPIQMKTVVDHTTGTFKFTDNLSGAASSETVGVEMTARLDSKNMPSGSGAIGQNDLMRSLKNKYKLHDEDLNKGHLLADSLGGKGNPRNLFPITRKANLDHADFIEKHVAAEILSQQASVANDGVEYSVKVQNPWLDDDFNKFGKGSKYVCNAHIINNFDNIGGLESKGADIISNVSIESKPDIYKASTNPGLAKSTTTSESKKNDLGGGKARWDGSGIVSPLTSLAFVGNNAGILSHNNPSNPNVVNPISLRPENQIEADRSTLENKLIGANANLQAAKLSNEYMASNSDIDKTIKTHTKSLVDKVEGAFTTLKASCDSFKNAIIDELSGRNNIATLETELTRMTNEVTTVEKACTSCKDRIGDMEIIARCYSLKKQQLKDATQLAINKDEEIKITTIQLDQSTKKLDKNTLVLDGMNFDANLAAMNKIVDDLLTQKDDISETKSRLSDELKGLEEMMENFRRMVLSGKQVEGRKPVRKHRDVVEKTLRKVTKRLERVSREHETASGEQMPKIEELKAKYQDVTKKIEISNQEVKGFEAKLANLSIEYAQLTKDAKEIQEDVDKLFVTIGAKDQEIQVV